MRTLIQDSNGEPVVWWSWQNLSKSSRLHGRAWLHTPNNSLGVEWVGRPQRASIGLNLSSGACGDDALLFSLHIPWLIGIYFSVSRLPWVEKLPGVKWVHGDHYSGERSLDVYWSFTENYIHWRLWCNPNISNAGDWRDRGVSVEDLLFGRSKYSQCHIVESDGSLAMPEGDYPCKITEYDATWTRKRWKKPETVHRVNLNFGERGVPIPGDGENGWDIDDDAVFETTMAAPNAEVALQNFCADVLKRRGSVK